MIVDEADKIFIDDVKDVPKLVKCVIGLTASVPGTEEGHYINKRLQHLEFHDVIKHPEHSFK